MTRPRLILASASPRRLELLRHAGLAPDLVLPADIDETPLPRELPGAYVLRLAAEKAQKIRSDEKDAVILAADTTVALGRRIIGKPETPEEAAAILRRLSGRRHRVLTGLAVLSPDGRQKARLAQCTVRFRTLPESEIRAYAATEEWKGKAGGYGIQEGRSATFVTFLSGTYGGIIGLPLIETLHLLRAAGYDG